MKLLCKYSTKWQIKFSAFLVLLCVFWLSGAKVLSCGCNIYVNSARNMELTDWTSSGLAHRICHHKLAPCCNLLCTHTDSGACKRSESKWKNRSGTCLCGWWYRAKECSPCAVHPRLSAGTGLRRQNWVCLHAVVGFVSLSLKHHLQSGNTGPSI